MKTALVGYTGFVGSNLAASHHFDNLYNSKNIEEAFGTKPNLLVYAGVRAEKFLANSHPEEDLRMIQEAEENIRRIRPVKVILISTIDVYQTPIRVDEQSEITVSGLQPYGANRCSLERRVRDIYHDALIVRLPALFGNNLKKNFIYDMLHPIPSILNAAKMKELSSRISDLHKFYRLQENGFYRYMGQQEIRNLRKEFEAVGFTSLQFTDSRSSYQFYNLKYLWKDLTKALKLDLHLLNLATEPLNAGELYQYITGKEFKNRLLPPVAEYDFRTVHAERMGGTGGYLYSGLQIKEEIKEYVEKELLKR